ncbi:MAG TPA: elongation factor G [Halanaerobiales bacterium]|nr:elongation factor G [Halanaerobiales bacterium]
MSNYKTKDIKNISFISHGGAGKTTLTEDVLFNAGKIEQIGSVDEGSTKSDFIPEEKEHKYSVNSSYFSFKLKENQVNLIDTPGYADFRGEVASATRMVESSVLLINADSGVEVNTNYVWNIAVENNNSRFVFINKFDKEGTNFKEVINELEENFEDSLLPITIPYKEGDEYKGVIDLLREKFIGVKDGKESELNDAQQEVLKEYKLELVESIIELDEELMLKYLEDEEITDEEMNNALLKGVLSKELVPVFSGSALHNSGVKSLMDYLLKLAPSAADRESLKVQAGEEEKEFETTEEGPFIGMVGKTMVDPYIGKLSIFRIYSGSIDKGEELYVPRTKDNYRVSKLYKLNGSEQEQVEQLIAGDIGAVAKLDDLETSDTITKEDLDIKIDPIKFPEPMLIKAAAPADEADNEKMSSAIQRYSLEDPTFKVDYNKATKQLLIKGMGTVHLSVVNDICKRKFDVGFNLVEPKVEYKETIRKKVSTEVKYKKQSGGRGQYGHVMIRFEPLPRGRGFEFDEEIFGGAIPSQYIPAVEKGILETKDDGVLANYPVVDFKATVYDGSYHDVDSSEMAFKIAASKAFKQAMQKAKPVILEPIMDVKVVVPESFMGDIMGDLNSRRGKISGMEPQDGTQKIKAKVPQSELFSYATDLKSITGGYGYFTMEFSNYEKVPSDISEQIIEKRANEED